MALQYPQARRGDTVDDFFGTLVADPYRWMEDPASPDVRAFIDAENEITHSFLSQIPALPAIRERFAALYKQPHIPGYGEASRYGEYYFYSQNLGQDQAVLMRRKGVDGAPEVVLDPNTLSADGSSILMQTQPSHDGLLLAYSISRGGSDWQEFHVRDLTTGQDYADVIEWCKFTRVAWKSDNSGFYYSRFPEVRPGEEKLAENFNSRIYEHRIGTPQSEDTLIFEDPENPNYLYWTEITDDGEYLALSVRRGAVGETGFYYWRIGSDKPFVRLLETFDSTYDFIGNRGTSFYFMTKLDAPQKRIIAIDIDQPEREHWRTIVPEQADTMEAAKMVGGQLIVISLHNAHSRMTAYDLDGTFLREIALPGMGSVATFTLKANASDSDFLFTFTSFLQPMTVYRYDTVSDSVSVFQASGLTIDPEQYETRQVFYPSTGGVQVSMFISHKRGLKLDGSNPTLIYAYGGFDVPVTPEFEVQNYVWMEQGGVYVVPNLRGGSEYGEAWHRGGMLEQKQHVFDDMIGAAEWLIANGYTSPSKVAIRGMSNGGLLVAACLTQRPELFGACLCGVPVIDMLRYHRFTAGRLWVGEYGSAENSADEFRYLHAYSPLHNIREGVNYPPTLIWSSDGDDRVVPMHSLKFTAALQAAYTGENPILLRFGTQAGHSTLNVNKVIEEEADFFAFLSAHLGWWAD